MLKKNRLFFKDFDGSIIEVPQRKIVVAASDLKKIKRLGQEGGATIHGDGSQTINEVVKRTYKAIKGNEAAQMEGIETNRERTGRPEDFGGASDLAALKRM